MNRATATILSDELWQNEAGDVFPALMPLVLLASCPARNLAAMSRD